MLSDELCWDVCLLVVVDSGLIWKLDFAVVVCSPAPHQALPLLACERVGWG